MICKSAWSSRLQIRSNRWCSVELRAHSTAYWPSLTTKWKSCGSILTLQWRVAKPCHSRSRSQTLRVVAAQLALASWYSPALKTPPNCKLLLICHQAIPLTKYFLLLRDDVENLCTVASEESESEDSFQDESAFKEENNPLDKKEDIRYLMPSHMPSYLRID